MKSEIQNPKSEITILLVDDSREVNDASARVIRAAGYNVIQAFDGNECLDLIQKCDPNLILLDVVMPGLSGIDVCRQVKAIYAENKPYIILLSGLRTSSEQQSEGLEAGADGYIARPLQNRELLARVEAGLRIVGTENKLRKALEKSSKLEKELLSLNATKDLFFAIISHDLRNQINSILGFSEILAELTENAGQENISEISKIIFDSSSQTYTLLDNLLLWSRSQSGNITVKPVKLSIKDCVEETVNLVRNQANTKSIKIDVNMSNDCYVIADKNMINTILRNLVSNAIKFTPEEGKISITCTGDNDKILISVIDSGVGMSVQTLSKLFKPEQVSSTHGTNHESGTGLGLILCTDFANKLGGSLKAESKSGLGSRFVLTLKTDES